ncbi:MAG TPA: phage terminase large subunit [Pyrinomonadaceae bacterium]|nr:phage terminase large subunit [Pyrinomonadaceae bacterium]
MSTNATIPRLKLPPKFGPVWNSVKPYQIWYGSRFSSKSYTKAIYFLQKAMASNYYRGIFARDTQKNVRGSQYQLFIDICNRFPAFQNKFKFGDSRMTVTCKQNGNFMVGGSFEQPDTLRSIADPTDFWAEEPITREGQIHRQDFLDIAGSLRNSFDVPPMFHFTFNPISKDTWIYEDFFDKKLYGDDVEILKINYYDNPYCPPDRVTFLDRLKIIDPERYKVDGEGEWGTAHEGLIYKVYTHVDEMPGIDFYGVDFGCTNPCAIVSGCIRDVMGQPKKQLYVKEELYETDLGETDLIAMMKKLGIRKDVPMICDNEDPGMISALRRAGYRAVKCTKYAGSVREGIRHVLDHNLFIVRGSENLSSEIRNYAWELGRDERPTDNPEPKSVCHALDALRYGAETTLFKKGRGYSW